MRAVDIYPPDLQATAAFLDLFRQQVFERMGSVFTPDINVWTPENLLELKQRVIESPDESEENFLHKLKRQLAGAGDYNIQLMAEVLYVYYSVSSKIHGRTKVARVTDLLQIMRRPIAVPAALISAADRGLASTGTFYQTNNWRQWGFLMSAVMAWRHLSPADQSARLRDPWAFKEFLMTVPENGGAPIRMAVLHFVFPDTFEIIVSADHKTRICQAFHELAPDETDEDRKLLAISRKLAGNDRGIWSFYESPYREKWYPTKEIKEPALKPTPDIKVAADIGSLAAELCIDSGWLEGVKDELLERRQIILHGPPGTGKTLIARRLSQLLAPNDRIHLLQFHPSYSYEDFVEGLRPTVGKAGAFEVRPGVIKSIAQKARANTNDRHILIIDEINRANLSRVMGELVFLLEYRDAVIRLPYSNEEFSLPPNVYIIGTMNSADRSIALFDAAIRRRFGFFRLAPDRPPVDAVLATWIDNHCPEMVWVAAMVDAANKIIGSPDHAIGPSFFLRDDLSEPVVRRVWNNRVLPYLDEFLHDAGTTRADLEYEALRGRVDREGESGE